MLFRSETPDTVAAREAWLAQHGPAHPVTVAIADGAVVGWAALSPFHPRSAYRFTVENAVYVHPAHLRCGHGGALLADLVSRAPGLGHRAVVALIDASQDASLHLHERHGFRRAGRLTNVGYKFGRWLDLIYMEWEPPAAEPQGARPETAMGGVTL